MPRDAVSRTANVERNGGHKWIKDMKNWKKIPLVSMQRKEWDPIEGASSILRYHSGVVFEGFQGEPRISNLCMLNSIKFNIFMLNLLIIIIKII